MSGCGGLPVFQFSLGASVEVYPLSSPMQGFPTDGWPPWQSIRVRLLSSLRRLAVYKHGK